MNKPRPRARPAPCTYAAPYHNIRRTQGIIRHHTSTSTPSLPTHTNTLQHTSRQRQAIPNSGPPVVVAAHRRRRSSSSSLVVVARRRRAAAAHRVPRHATPRRRRRRHRRHRRPPSPRSPPHAVARRRRRRRPSSSSSPSSPSSPSSSPAGRRLRRTPSPSMLRHRRCPSHLSCVQTVQGNVRNGGTTVNIRKLFQLTVVARLRLQTVNCYRRHCVGGCVDWNR